MGEIMDVVQKECDRLADNCKPKMRVTTAYAFAVDSGYQGLYEDYLAWRNGQLELQQEAARYVFHKVVKARYMEKIAEKRISTEQGQELYDKAMANYDGIIDGAVTGASRGANNRDMGKGFG